jgi:hypothetical protein
MNRELEIMRKALERIAGQCEIIDVNYEKLMRSDTEVEAELYYASTVLRKKIAREALYEVGLLDKEESETSK